MEVKDLLIIEQEVKDLILLEKVKARLSIEDNDFDAIINAIIEDVWEIALSTRYPFDYNKQLRDLEPRFENWVVRATVQVYTNFGTLNVKQYSENGLSFTYGAIRDGVSIRLLNEIMPKAGGVGV